MTQRGWVEQSVSFVKCLGDAKRMRQRARIVLLVGMAVLMLWISPTTAQMTGAAAFEIGPAQFTGTDTIAIAGDATGTGQTGVVGHAWATTGQTWGVRGVTNSPGDATTGLAAYGVFGRATDTTAASGSGLAIGVGGRSDAPGGIGVNGRAAATTGQNFGVRGITNSVGDSTNVLAAFGVFGHATAPSGFTIGVNGQADGIGDLTNQAPAIGVRGRAPATTTGFTIGVRGDSFSPGDAALSLPSIGVDGRAMASSGNAIGVRGITNSSTGTGVVGTATSTTGANTGVSGFSAGIGDPINGNAVGVMGIAGNPAAPARAQSIIGVMGYTNSPGGVGVKGFGGATTGVNIGVLGRTDSVGGTAVSGFAASPSGSTIAVQGLNNSPNGVAISGYAPNGGRAGDFGGPVNITCSSPTNSCLFVNNTAVAVPDLAEDMPVARPVSPGDVVVLAPGQGYGVAPATRAYDTMVAGVVSTAPRVRFGIGRVKAAPVAMVGVVKAKATAVNGAIKYGDLLTTSPVPGRLMRCDAAIRCVGAIVGKALEPLAKGEQSILVLLWRQ